MVWLIPISIVLGAAAVALLLPTISDLWSLAALAAGRGRPRVRTDGATPALLFFVPAHNEELLIDRCVRSLAALDYPRDLFSVVVIADNCTDRTAEIAVEAGARCLERDDPELPGKPQAIAWALDQCRLDEFDAMIIIDADTVVDAGFARALARIPNLREEAAQAYNGVLNPDDSHLSRMGHVLATAYYDFIYPFKDRADINPPLTGPGMCIGTAPLMEHGWQAFSIVEDIEMYVLLTLYGIPIHCLHEARVYVHEEPTLETSGTQRQRWRAGRLTILGRLSWTILRQTNVSMRQRFDLFAELVPPGPVVHFGTVLLLSAVAFLLPVPGGRWIALALLVSLVRPITYTALAIRSDRRPADALRAFLFLPWYTVWRLANEAVAIGRMRGKGWIRTTREEPVQKERSAR